MTSEKMLARSGPAVWQTASDRQLVAKKLHLLGQLAVTRGSAIGIGHVGRHGSATADALTEVLTELQRQGIRFVTLSTLDWDSK